MDPRERADRTKRALDRWGDAVFRVALAQTRSRADAQDVSQEAFMRLLHENRAFKDDEHLKAWLLRVAINICRDQQKSAWAKRVDLEGASTGSHDGSDAHPPLSNIPDADEPVEDRVVRELTRHPVWTFMEELPAEQRAVMHLHYVEDLPCDEIARILGVSVITVRTRMHRARTKLRALMQGAKRREAKDPRDTDPAGEHEPGRRMKPASSILEGGAAHEHIV